MLLPETLETIIGTMDKYESLTTPKSFSEKA